MDLSMGVLCGWRRPTMEILYPRCAGLDGHKESVAVCVLTPGPQAEPDKQIQQFGTTTFWKAPVRRSW
jgi:hypothetical protein